MWFQLEVYLYSLSIFIYSSNLKLDNQIFIYHYAKYLSEQNIVFSFTVVLTLWPTCPFLLIAVDAMMFNPLPPLRAEESIFTPTCSITQSWVLSENFPGLEGVSKVTTPYKVYLYLQLADTE